MAAVVGTAFFNLPLSQSSSSPPSNPPLFFRFHRHKPPLRALISTTSCSCSAVTSHSQPSSADPQQTADSSSVPSSSSAGDDPLPERTRDRRKVVRLAWEKLVRWSRSWRSKAKTDVLERTKKVGLFNWVIMSWKFESYSQLGVLYLYLIVLALSSELSCNYIWEIVFASAIP